ncbi:MAG: class I SAM-dependent methyltransferase [Pirellulales bacterium]
MNLLYRLARRLVPQRDAVRYGNLDLPLAAMRWGTSELKDDAYYVQSATAEVERLQRWCGLTSQSRVLDIGSGQGRLAIGLLASFPDGPPNYHGIDVDLPSVRWCRRWIAQDHASITFTHINVANARYNAQGQEIIDGFTLPTDDAAYDVAFCYSVFTHMLSGHVWTYLGELHRVLLPGGRALVTAYVEENVPDEEENPAGYLAELGESKGRLHRVRFSRTFFESMVARTGLAIERFEHRSEPRTKQTALVLRRP